MVYDPLMRYTVKAVADMAGISIRALYHYDAIGLLKPSGSSLAGYRQYGEADLERLQEVLFFRELGFSLQEIKEMVDNPSYDRRQALALHRDLLLEKRKRLDDLLRNVGQTLDSMERGRDMATAELFGGLDEAKLEEYRKEAKERWGSVVDDSYRRYNSYTKAQKDAMWSDISSIYTGIAAKMDRDPGSPEVQELVGRWYRVINEKFYTCTPEVFRGLGEMYVQDQRFTDNIDKVKPGLARYLKEAMGLYADKLEA